MIRGGRHVGDRTFFPRHADAVDASTCRRSSRPSSSSTTSSGRCRRPIVVPDADDHAALAEVAVRAVRAEGRDRRQSRRRTARMAGDGAAERDAGDSPDTGAEGHAGGPPRRTAARRSACRQSAQRIECFDISHTMGEAAVASCVIFDRLAMQTAEYRRFNVTPRAGRRRLRGDARGAVPPLRAHRRRRVPGARPAGHRRRQGAGGRGRRRAGGAGPARRAADRHRQGTRAQGRARRRSSFPERDDALRLPADHPGLHLLQQIRDEAHRFAIQGHRARRAKARTTSTLHEIAGIGAAKRRALLAHFGGVRGVQAASVEDLARVPGISRALAERIFAQLH